MKKKTLLFSALAGLTSLALSSYSSGPAANGQGNRTTTGCSGGGCHGSTSTSVSAALSITSNGAPVTSYVPGQQYTITLTGANSAGGHPRFGFQTTCTQANNTQAGTFSTTSTGVAVRNNIGGLQIVEHSTSLTGTSNAYTVSFNWIAPATGVGQVKFSAVLNSVNGNGAADAADNYAITSLSVSEATTGIGTVGRQLALNVYPVPATSVLHVKAGSDLGRNATVAIYDLTGRALLQQAVAAGAEEITLPVAQLPAGHYVAVVRNEQGRGVMNFIKQ